MRNEATIRQKLKISAYVLVGLTSILVTALLFSAMRTRNAAETGRYAAQIAKGASELNSLALAYALRPAERPLRQWEERYDSLALLMEGPLPGSPRKREILGRIGAAHESAKRLFYEILSNLEARSGLSPAERALREESWERLIAQLIAKTQTMVQEASLLLELSERETERIQLVSFGIVLTLILLLLAVVLVTFFNIYRTILTPLTNLKRGATAVAAGDLDCGIPVGRDEFGEVAAAFNSMCDALRKARGEMEGRVEERTEDLRGSEERLRLALEAGEIGTFEADLDRGLITGDSRCRAFLCMEEEVISTKDAGELIHPEDREAVRAAADRACDPALREAYRIQHRVLLPGGDVRWIAARGNVTFDENSSPPRALRMVGVMQDITELKRAEETLKRARDDLEMRVQERTAELQLKNQELQDFAFIASHDLQEPLRKIQMFGDLLAEGLSSSLGRKEIDFIERMRNAAKRMQDLLESLLTYSRVTTKAQPFEEVDLREAATEAISNLEARIRGTAAVIELGELPAVEADPTQMTQLFQNLVGNALKFHRPGVPPRVRIHSFILPGSQDGDETLRIEVRDNGIGFEERHVDRIFSPFERLHGRSAFDGVGMGLTICRKIVERHKGSIKAESAPGEGSTFIVTLPLEQARTGEV